MFGFLKRWWQSGMVGSVLCSFDVLRQREKLTIAGAVSFRYNHTTLHRCPPTPKHNFMKRLFFPHQNTTHAYTHIFSIVPFVCDGYNKEGEEKEGGTVPRTQPSVRGRREGQGWRRRGNARLLQA